MAKHVSDYKKSSADILLDLVNEQNGSSLTAAQVQLSITGTGNTKATVVSATAKVGSGYRGKVDMNYNRVQLNEIPSIVETVVGFDAASVTTVVVLEDINTRYGVNIDATEVALNGGLADPIALAHDEITDVNFSATANNSVVWVGSTVLKLTRLSQALSEAWPTTTLDGLYPPGGGSVTPPDLLIGLVGTASMVGSSMMVNDLSYAAGKTSKRSTNLEIVYCTPTPLVEIVAFLHVNDAEGNPLPEYDQPYDWFGDHIAEKQPWSFWSYRVAELEEQYGITIPPGSLMATFRFTTFTSYVESWTSAIEAYGNQGTYNMTISGRFAFFSSTFIASDITTVSDVDGSLVSEEDDRLAGSVNDIVRLEPYTAGYGEVTVESASEPTSQGQFLSVPLKIMDDPTRSAASRTSRLRIRGKMSSQFFNAPGAIFGFGTYNDGTGKWDVVKTQGQIGSVDVELLSGEFTCEYSGTQPVKMLQDGFEVAPGEDCIVSANIGNMVLTIDGEVVRALVKLGPNAEWLPQSHQLDGRDAYASADAPLAIALA